MSYAKINTYKRIEATGASKLEEVAILLEYCSQLLQEAIQAITQEEYEKRYQRIDKVIMIISTLQSAMNTETSEEGKYFNGFFENAIYHLVQVNLNQDATLCLKVREKLLEMARLWRHAHGQEKSQTYQGTLGAAPSKPIAQLI